MSNEQDERIHNELALVEAMYPDQTAYDERTGELKYTSDLGSFRLRLPEGYLVDQLPEILSASSGREDLRERLKPYIQICRPGEEVLDFIVSSFKELLELQSTIERPVDVGDGEARSLSKEDSSRATVVVWLHHLLNTNKRKQALSPPSSSVSGITKPGYPGVLIYSGPAKAVREHVNELKQLNWQAFQVRLENDEEWSFNHGTGVIEVETMKEVVAEVGEVNKMLFMEAMRMK